MTLDGNKIDECINKRLNTERPYSDVHRLLGERKKSLHILRTKNGEAIIDEHRIHCIEILYRGHCVNESFDTKDQIEDDELGLLILPEEFEKT